MKRLRLTGLEPWEHTTPHGFGTFLDDFSSVIHNCLMVMVSLDAAGIAEGLKKRRIGEGGICSGNAKRSKHLPKTGRIADLQFFWKAADRQAGSFQKGGHVALQVRSSESESMMDMRNSTNMRATPVCSRM